MMKILVALSPFFADLPDLPGVTFTVNPWGGEPDAELIEKEMLAGQYDALIIGTKRVKNTIADQCPGLKAISRVGVGYDNIDVPYFTEKGVVVAYTPLGPTDSTAEMAVSLILAAQRRIVAYNDLVRQGQWTRYMGKSLKESTVGIVGFGRIGKRVSTLLRGFGCNVLLHDIAPDYGTANALGFPFVDKQSLLRSCDILTFHVPLKADTRNWLSSEELALLPAGTVVVNTARGGIVDEAAMAEYLRVCPESWYACDVFVEEPYHGPLLACPNAIVTPHASSYTRSSRIRTEEMAIDNCIKILKGEPCAFVVEKNE